MSSNSRLRDPLATVRGLGSAKTGVSHWWIQRLTAIALVPLTIGFVMLMLSLLHADYDTARASVAQPMHAILLLAFVCALFWHMQLGLQVIVEDYVHIRWLEVALQIILKLLCALGALVSIWAIVRVALSA